MGWKDVLASLEMCPSIGRASFMLCLHTDVCSRDTNLRNKNKNKPSPEQFHSDGRVQFQTPKQPLLQRARSTSGAKLKRTSRRSASVLTAAQVIPESPKAKSSIPPRAKR